MTNKRNVPLDIFRGMIILIMVFVNSPPDLENIYFIFKHAPWEGITIADLAFPGFVFAMGASLAFSLNNKNRKRLKTNIWLKKLCARTGILFCLGVVFNASPQIINFLLTGANNFVVFIGDLFNGVRILGVLQRLALVYFFGSIIIRIFDGKHLLKIAFLLLIVSSVLFHIYSPSAPFLQENNLSIFIDLTVMGENHILGTNPLYEPEGFFGVLASIASMFFGIYGAKLLIDEDYRGLVFFGTSAIFWGGVWSNFDIISKPLWTAPFVFLTTGFCVYLLLIIAVLYKKFQSVHKIFYPVLGFGKNPIFFYLATEFALVLLLTIGLSNGNSLYFQIYQFTVKGFVNDAFSSALFTFVWCLLWVPVAYWLYKKDIVIKI